MQELQWANEGKARGQEMEEDSGSDMPDVEDDDEVVLVEEDDVDPKDRMDSSNLERVRPREGTARPIATPNPNDSNMGLPTEVEMVDEDEEMKRSKKRRTREEEQPDIGRGWTSEATGSIGVGGEKFQQANEKAETTARMKDGVSNPKPPRYEPKAGGSKAKTGGLIVDDKGRRMEIGEEVVARYKEGVISDPMVMEDKFIDENGRRKEIGDEEVARYRKIANDNELSDRKFCESYGHILASVKCSMAKCAKPGCALKIFTKGYDFKDKTKVKSRGSVKGTRCGKSVAFGACLQQLFNLGIL